MKKPSPKRSKKIPRDVDEYIAALPPPIRKIFKNIRKMIIKTVPAAEERISYRMPAFFFHGVLVYVGVFKNHIGIYPPVRDEGLKRLTEKYRGEKGNLKFALDESMPYGLIARIVKARLRENLQKKVASNRSK